MKQQNWTLSTRNHKAAMSRPFHGGQIWLLYFASEYLHKWFLANKPYLITIN